ncbi:hypothetical protein [Marinicellulosiphila megalodicopiae]|uniref:hypothetical protein n=1 Tax=Marinicellulosiphila megalodicopiae TaxID=2724896 RepID=UPI003BB0EFFC
MRYDIFFRGQIVENTELNTVKANVKALFNASDDKLAQLFSGAPVLIKADVDQATAAKYKGAMQNAGAVAMVVSKEQPQTETFETPNTQNQNDGNNDYLEPQIQVKENFDEVLGSLSSITVAQVGEGYLAEAIVIEDLDFDFSSWSIANTGSNLDVAEEDSPPPPPDTSHLSFR